MTEQPPPRPDVERLAVAVEQLATAMRVMVEAAAPAIAAMAAALDRARTATRDDYALAPPPLFNRITETEPPRV